MATYVDIYALSTNETLIQKAAVAVGKTAKFVLDGGGTVPPGDLGIYNSAKRALVDPRREAQANFMWYLVSDATIQQAGTAATDEQVSTVVDTYRDKIWGPAPAAPPVQP